MTNRRQLRIPLRFRPGGDPNPARIPLRIQPPKYSLSIAEVQIAAGMDHVYTFDNAGTPTEDIGTSPADLTEAGLVTNHAPIVQGTRGYYHVTGGIGNYLLTVSNINVARTADVFFEGIFQIQVTGGVGEGHLADLGEQFRVGMFGNLTIWPSSGELFLRDDLSALPIRVSGWEAWAGFDPIYVAVWWDHSNLRFRFYYRKAGGAEFEVSSAVVFASGAGANPMWIGSASAHSKDMNVHNFAIKRGALTAEHRNNIYAAMGIA